MKQNKSNKKKAPMRKGSKPKQRAPTPKKKASSVKFGPVTSINTAPVAYGNSMRGVEAKVVQTSKDMVRIVGRDYAYTAANTGNASGWTPAGGFPLTPAVFVSSILRSYTQMYNKFKFNSIALHYITSSATSTNGDVLFQINANRSDPLPNWTATTFLPYALSRPDTVIGPQWMNHTCIVRPKGPVRTLVPLASPDIDYQAQGEVFLFSKTSSVESPGYVLIDYDITFYEMSVNPHSGQLPNPNFLYQPFQLYWLATAYTGNSTKLTLTLGTAGPGQVPITSLWGNGYTKQGDVFKLGLDLTNTVMKNYTVTSGSIPTATSLFSQVINGIPQTLSLTDGYTLYMVIENSTNVTLYTTLTNAVTAANAITAASTMTPAAYTETTATSNIPATGVWLFGYASLVGTTTSPVLQQT
jgi:hypothetical protein